LPPSTNRLAGFIELITTSAEVEFTDNTLLGTLQVIADPDDLWIGRVTTPRNRPTADETLVCDRDNLLLQLEREFWQLESHLQANRSR
jgi:hypothetical protein